MISEMQTLLKNKLRYTINSNTQDNINKEETDHFIDVLEGIEIMERYLMKDNISV